MILKNITVLTGREQPRGKGEETCTVLASKCVEVGRRQLHAYLKEIALYFRKNGGGEVQKFKSGGIQGRGSRYDSGKNARLKKSINDHKQYSGRTAQGEGKRHKKTS